MLSGSALLQDLFPSWLKDFRTPICPIWSCLERTQKFAACPSDSFFGVVPKLHYALEKVLRGNALFQELFPSWLKDFGPPVCPTRSYLKRLQRPRTSQHILQIRSWRWYPLHLMLQTGAEWQRTAPGAIPELAEGFWTTNLRQL